MIRIIGIYGPIFRKIVENHADMIKESFVASGTIILDIETSIWFLHDEVTLRKKGEDFTITRNDFWRIEIE